MLISWPKLCRQVNCLFLRLKIWIQTRLPLLVVQCMIVKILLITENSLVGISFGCNHYYSHLRKIVFLHMLFVAWEVNKYNDDKVFIPIFWGQLWILFYHSALLRAIFLVWRSINISFLNYLYQNLFRPPSSPCCFVTYNLITFSNWPTYWPALHKPKSSQCEVLNYCWPM